MAESLYADLSEAAELLNLSKSFLYKNTMNKTIPFRKVGRKLLFDRAELKAWVESRVVVSAKGA
jgi:excisionase family DNA binding protein